MISRSKWSVLILILLGLLVVGSLAACQSEYATAPTTQEQAAEPAQPAAPPSPKTIVVEVNRNAGNLAVNEKLTITRGMDEVSQECIECHKAESPGIVNDWKESRHGHTPRPLSMKTWWEQILIFLCWCRPAVARIAIPTKRRNSTAVVIFAPLCKSRLKTACRR